MAKASGGTRIKGDHGFQIGDDNYKGRVSSVESLKSIKNPAVYNSAKDAIARYHSVLGVRQRTVKLADLPDGILGVHVTKDGESAGVFLNKSVFQPDSVTTRGIADTVKKAYDTGFLTRTNKPVAHAITHELAHATWNAHMTTAKAKAAEPDIKKLYKQWATDKNRKGYGKYASANVSEWFAETATKAVHGSNDMYAAAIKRIIKKHNL